MIDKKALKILCLFIFLLVFSPLISGCFFGKNKAIDYDNWEEQIIYASKCGMDGLTCCPEKDQRCLFGQQCCVDPNDQNRNMCADECACGREGAFCCGGDQPCEAGLACFAGYCVACGGISDPCCQGENKCGERLTCHNNFCVVCGIPGNPCCQAGIPCANQEKRDRNRTECRNDICIFCGSDGQIACRHDPFCAPGHLINNNFCLNCGGPNQPCCDSESGAGYICESDDLVCELGFCTKK